MLDNLIRKGNLQLQYDIYCESLLTLLPAYLPSATYTESTEPLPFLFTSVPGDLSHLEPVQALCQGTPACHSGMNVKQNFHS